MAIIYEKEAWLNSQLSVARFYGGININGQGFKVVRGGQLVREDFVGVVNSLGADVVVRALNRYGEQWRARKVCQRLARIIKARKKQSQGTLL